MLEQDLEMTAAKIRKKIKDLQKDLYAITRTMKLLKPSSDKKGKYILNFVKGAINSIEGEFSLDTIDDLNKSQNRKIPRSGIRQVLANLKDRNQIKQVSDNDSYPYIFVKTLGFTCLK